VFSIKKQTTNTYTTGQNITTCLQVQCPLYSQPGVDSVVADFVSTSQCKSLVGVISFS